jgi:hypothetical protein
VENLIESADREPVMVFTSGVPHTNTKTDASIQHPNRGAGFRPDDGGRRRRLTDDSLKSDYWGSSTDLDSAQPTLSSTKVLIQRNLMVFRQA